MVSQAACSPTKQETPSLSASVQISSGLTQGKTDLEEGTGGGQT